MVGFRLEFLRFARHDWITGLGVGLGFQDFGFGFQDFKFGFQAVISGLDFRFGLQDFRLGFQISGFPA